MPLNSSNSAGDTPVHVSANAGSAVCGKIFVGVSPLTLLLKGCCALPDAAASQQRQFVPIAPSEPVCEFE